MELERKPSQNQGDEPKKKRIMPIIIVIVIIILLGIIALTSSCQCSFGTGDENGNTNATADENTNKGTASQAMSFGVGFSPSSLKVGLTSAYDLNIGNYSEGDLIVESVELTWFNGETEVSQETVDQTSANWQWQEGAITQDQKVTIYEEEKAFNEVGAWILKAKVNTNKGSKEIEGNVEVHSGNN